MRINNNYNNYGNNGVGFNALFANRVKELPKEMVKAFRADAKGFLSDDERFFLMPHVGAGNDIVYGKLVLKSKNPEISGMFGNPIVLGYKEGDSFILTPRSERIVEDEMAKLENLANRRLH